MKPQRNKTRLLLITLGLGLLLVACGPTVTSGQAGKSFEVKENTQLEGGEHTFSSVNIPSGVTVTATDDVVINVTGDTVIAGTLSGDCVGIALRGQGDVAITGNITNECGENAEETKDLIIQTDGGVLQIGTEDSPATLYTSGLLDITNDPSLEEWEFDVLPDQRSEAPLPPVCSAQADTIAGTATPDAPEEVAFYGAGVDPDGGPVTYAWDFGDGQSSTEAEPFHTYQNGGVYDVVLTVADDDEETCQATLRVVLDDGEQNVPDAPGLWVEPLDLVTGTGQEAIFNSDALDPLGQELTYHWDFGDGATSTEAEPFHTYTEAGRYPVVLSVTSPDGATSTVSTSIYVYATPAVGEARSPGLAHPVPAPPSQSVVRKSMIATSAKFRSISGRFSGDLTILPNTRFIAGAGPDGVLYSSRGLVGGGFNLYATGDLNIDANVRIEAGQGGKGYAPYFPRSGVTGGEGGRGGNIAITAGGDMSIDRNVTVAAGRGGAGADSGEGPRGQIADGRVRGGRGGRGGNLGIQAGKQIIIQVGTNIEGGDGERGGHATAKGENPRACGGEGGSGGHVIIKAAQRLIIRDGAAIIGGSGYPGGDASAKGKKPEAHGGRGGKSGDMLLFAVEKIEFGPFGAPPVTIRLGRGGSGGEAQAIGDAGVGTCKQPADGSGALAHGGEGGLASKMGAATGKISIPLGVIVTIEGGQAGDGGKGVAQGGDGSNAVECAEIAVGGNGGAAEAHGGKGGNAVLKGNVLGIAGIRVAMRAFVAGDGGEALANGGQGGRATATAPACKDATAKGGGGAEAIARGGRGGEGKTSGSGGMATAKAGNGGNAEAGFKDRKCAQKCKNGGNATATGGRGGDAQAVAGTATATAGNGGHAKAWGQEGGDCGDCPAGQGGNGGDATATGGDGGKAIGDGKTMEGNGGNADASGGRGAKGATCCSPPQPGGNGGQGGDAKAVGGKSLAGKAGVATPISGNGGQGGDGNLAGQGGQGGIPGGNPGNAGKACPPATATVSPTPALKEAVADQISTATPALTFTPTSAAREWVDECNTYLEQGRQLLAQHATGGCTEGIRLLKLAIEKSSAALELHLNDPEACLCRAMSRIALEQELNQAIGDLECALVGLEGNRRVEAERELARLREQLAAPICVSMGAPLFAEAWDWDAGVPVKPGTEFPANSTREVWARWTLSNPCNEVGVVKWYHDGLHVCQHDTDELTGAYDGSGWTADEEWLEPGLWCVAVWIGDAKMTEGCFTVVEQAAAPPSSGAPEILSIEFPSPIPADGTPFDGRLQFRDSEGDINYVGFDVTSGDFSGFGFNPMDFIVEGNVEQGVSLFNMHCNIVQNVTMRVTLYDAAGNSSPPLDFSFSCQ